MLAQVAKLLLAACLLTSCADAPSPAADSGAATNPGAPRWSIEPRPSILLGGGQSPHEAFGRIVGVSMLSGGRIAVADASIQQVLVFDSSGRLAFRWGRAGSGPGEFRNLAGISVAAESLFAFETAPGPSKYHVLHIDDGTFAQGALRDSAGRLRVLGRFGSGASALIRPERKPLLFIDFYAATDEAYVVPEPLPVPGFASNYGCGGVNVRL